MGRVMHPWTSPLYYTNGYTSSHPFISQIFWLERHRGYQSIVNIRLMIVNKKNILATGSCWLSFDVYHHWTELSQPTNRTNNFLFSYFFILGAKTSRVFPLSSDMITKI
jgi:hypothetical protein